MQIVFKTEELELDNKLRAFLSCNYDVIGNGSAKLSSILPIVPGRQVRESAALSQFLGVRLARVTQVLRRQTSREADAGQLLGPDSRMTTAFQSNWPICASDLYQQASLHVDPHMALSARIGHRIFPIFSHFLFEFLHFLEVFRKKILLLLGILGQIVKLVTFDLGFRFHGG